MPLGHFFLFSDNIVNEALKANVKTEEKYKGTGGYILKFFIGRTFKTSTTMQKGHEFFS